MKWVARLFDVIWFIALFYFGKPPKSYDDKLGM